MTPDPDGPPNPIRSVTLRDVARAAGTTPMTVSNVLNNRVGAVSAATSRRVREVALELGYRPNSQARRLRIQRTQTIGVVMVDPSPYYLSDPLTAAMLAGLTATLGRHDYTVLLHGIAPDQIETARVLQTIETDGICAILSGDKSARAQLMRRISNLNQPLMMIQEPLSDDVADGAAVYFDDRRGARAVLSRILTQDVQSVMFLVPLTEWPAMTRREEGLRDALKGAGTKARLIVVRCADEGMDATQAALARAIEKHGLPDILIGGNDQMALAGMCHLQAAGHSIPDQVQVAGFNGLDFARFAAPRLTTVASPAFALGETAADALLMRLRIGSFPFREMLIPVTPDMRQSTRPEFSLTTSSP